MIESRHLKWKGRDLYWKDHIMVSVVKDSKEKGMYRVLWPDGVISNDWYNLTRAKWNSIEWTITYVNKYVEIGDSKPVQKSLEV